MIGFVVLVVALARPRATVALPRPEGTVMITFDVSASMAATDLPPTRMDAARTIAETIVKQQPAGVVIGLVAFSDAGIRFTRRPAIRPRSSRPSTGLRPPAARRSGRA